MKTNYLEAGNGNKSSSRLIGFIVVMAALLESAVILFVGAGVTEPNIMTMATAAGVVFTTIAAPAMAFLFVQKKNETSTELKQ